ncbi:hypothetical protein VaNZ11_016674 [Volvox africanus]|uniref:WW domain-containing protein n=1 Tax=Volvox africanus TaxID=51714 RepID=A0ABQ5SP66_9CHLO|nr:hypothetical protein VaNZ11_016674 [Volvox africanus]
MGEEKTPQRPSRLAPAALAPLPQRPPLDPLSSQQPLPSFAKPRLPTTLPSQATPPAEATPSPLSSSPTAAANKTPAPPLPLPPALPTTAALTTSSPGDTRAQASLDGPVSTNAARSETTAATEPAPAEASVSTAAALQSASQQSQQPPPQPQPGQPGQTDAPHSQPATATQSQAVPREGTASAAAPPPLQPISVPADAPSPSSGPLLTLPGAVPTTPVGSGQPNVQKDKGGPVAANAGAAAAGAQGQAPASRPIVKREPPRDPPPPAAVGHMAVIMDCRTVEQYIPFGFVELRGRLLADFPEVFSDPSVSKKFVELCTWMSLRNTLRLAIDYGDADEKYSPLDPDKDTLAFKVASVEETSPSAVSSTSAVAPAPGPAKSLLPKNDMKSMVADLYDELDKILEKAEFSELPPEDLEKATKHKSLMGLEVIPASSEYLEHRIHYRGTRTRKIQFRRWGLFRRQIEMNVYERLAVCFRLKKPVSKDDVSVEEASGNSVGIDTRPWYRRLTWGRRPAVAPALMDLRDEFVYMKLFKDVLQSDIDMLLPGAVIKFTWFDYLMVWVPIIVGCGMAVWKAINGTIDFSNLINAALSIVLIVMPITWGVRAYFAIKEKQRLHQAHLNALFLMHNLNNNAGVIAQLLGEAQEQEDNETMLAYFFLWRGEASPKPMPKIDLDRAVEAYLQNKLDDIKIAIRMDYEVLDSISKLERLGLVHTTRGADGVRRLQALPLDLALEKAHVRHFDESREAGQPEVPPAEAKRQGAISLSWHECIDIFGPTGQKFRYFWNAETGESQYQEPDEPYIKLGASAALDFADAYGINLADPQKHPPALHHAKTA